MTQDLYICECVSVLGWGSLSVCIWGSRSFVCIAFICLCESGNMHILSYVCLEFCGVYIYDVCIPVCLCMLVNLGVADAPKVVCLNCESVPVNLGISEL